MWATAAGAVEVESSSGPARDRAETREVTHLVRLFGAASRPRRRPYCKIEPGQLVIEALGQSWRDGQQARGVEHPDDLLDDGNVGFGDVHPQVERRNQGRAHLLPGDGREVGVRLDEDLRGRRASCTRSGGASGGGTASVRLACSFASGQKGAEETLSMNES